MALFTYPPEAQLSDLELALRMSREETDEAVDAPRSCQAARRGEREALEVELEAERGRSEEEWKRLKTELEEEREGRRGGEEGVRQLERELEGAEGPMSPPVSAGSLLEEEQQDWVEVEEPQEDREGG